jgi:hypothetical protein
MGVRSHNCLPRADRLAYLILLKFHVFPSAENGTVFDNKKPGAVTRPGIRVTLNYNYFYRNHVTLSSKNF